MLILWSLPSGSLFNLNLRAILMPARPSVSHLAATLPLIARAHPRMPIPVAVSCALPLLPHIMPAHTNFKVDPGNHQTMKLPFRPARACDTGTTETVDMATPDGDHQMADVHSDVIQAHLVNLQLASLNALQSPVSDSNEVVPATKYDSQGADNPDIDEGIYELATGGTTRDDSGSDSDSDDDDDMVTITRKEMKRLKFYENFVEEISKFQDASERQLYEVGARLAMEKTDKTELIDLYEEGKKNTRADKKRIRELEAQLKVLSMRDSNNPSVGPEGDDLKKKVDSED